MKFGIGQPVSRIEDLRLLRGAGRYVDDIRLPDQATAFFVRSPVAHALLRSVDVSGAKGRPGVLAALTANDVAALGLKPLGARLPFKGVDGAPAAPVLMPPLAEGRIRYVGEPVAMIVAETPAQARDAAEFVELDYTELPVIAGPRAALEEDAVQLHDDAPGNRAYHWEAGDRAATDAAFASAARTVSVRARNQRIAVMAMEPRAINVAYDPDLDRWTAYCATQGSHAMRGAMADGLGVPEEKLRVITPDVGGGFGMKLMVHPEYALCAAAARKTGRPVRWTADRSESFLGDLQGRDLDSEAEAAFDADGRLLAMRVRSVSGLGAYYGPFGIGIHSMFSGDLVGGLYKLPVFHNEVVGAFDNTTPTDAFRGAGRPEIIYVTERLMDAAARAFDMDPAEIRRRNLLTAADMPHTSITNVTFDSGACAAMLDAALEAADYAGFGERRREAEARGKRLGVGVSYYMERTGGGPVENARIRIRADGRVEAWIGTQSTGQGHETAWAQIIGEKLGVSASAIDFPPGDSDLLPAGGGTGGSRSLIMGHRVFFAAADDIIEKGRKAASETLEASVADIEFSPEEGGRFRVAGTDRSIDLFEAAAAAADLFGEPALLGEGGVSDRESTFPNGAHVAEAEIDPETGRVAITRYTVVDDFGRILNPLMVTGQVHGGIAQGVGQALLEQMIFDPDTAQPMTGSLMDYVVARADDMPPLHTVLDERAPTPTNPLGVKGCGEAGTVGSIPATTLAVLNALASAGVDADALQTPLTPVRVWEALQTAQGASDAAA